MDLMCSKCGKLKEDPSYKLCARCREYNRKRAAEGYKKDKEKGVCVISGCHEPAVPGRTRCAKCLEIGAIEQRARYLRYKHEYLKRDRARKEKRKKEGLCVSCGAKLDDPKRVTCINCRTRTLWPQGTFLYYRGKDEDNHKGST